MKEPPTRAPVESAPSRVKDPAIETLRGLAIVLVVMGHVIGIDASRSMQVAPDSFWRLLYLVFVDIRLPLFTVISGYIYAMRPLSSLDGMPGLVKTKSRRLLLPLVTVGTLLFFSQMAIPGTTFKPVLQDYYRIFFFGYEHLWFLQSIFVIFVMTGLLDALGVLRTLRGALVAFAASLVMFEVIPIPREADVFSVSGVLRLLPFFLLGYILFRYPPRNGSYRLCAAIAAPVLVLAYTLRFASFINGWTLNPYADRIVSASIGIAAVLLLFAARGWLKSRPLSWIGGFAFAIYLLHPFGTAAARILLGHEEITTKPVLFAVGLTAGLIWPIIFEKLTKRSRVIQTFILGEKWQPKSQVGIQHQQ